MNDEDLKEIVNNINYAKEQKGCYENTYLYFKVSAIEKLVNENQQLKDRIDNAIEYIKEHEFDHRDNFRSLIYADDLLEILKGADNE